MIDYFVRYYDKLLKALTEHVRMVGTALILSILISAIITILVMDYKKISKGILHICSIIYSIPSLALFAILIPLTGLGTQTAVTVLVIYNQYILVRSFLEGLDRVNPSIVEAAIGMGMGRQLLFLKIKLPLALDSIVAGIRIAIISTIGIGTIGATIGAGGIGSILFDGMRTQNTVKIIWGTILSVLMVLVTDGILSFCEKKVKFRIYHTLL